MSTRSSVGSVALATSISLCASLHAQPANEPEALPEIHQPANRPEVLPEIRVIGKRVPIKKPFRSMSRVVNASGAHVSRQAAPGGTPRVAGPPAAPTPSAGAESVAGPPSAVTRFALPQRTVSITARQIDQTINLKDPEDAVKYMPSLFVRKRNDGDNQAVLATRTWGLNSSARTLIYADDLLISALIGNNNTGASPHWNLVSPESIARVDFLDGPYAAAYPGNSMGGVLLITSKMPDKFQATAKETVSVQPWNQYATKDTYLTTQSSMSVGNRVGALSWLFSANYLDAFQQPLTYTTNGTPPAGTIGTIPALNKQGLVADVVGTGALIHTKQAVANLKITYDITPSILGTYSFGIWNNDQTSSPQTYLRSAITGAPTFGGISSFANSEYTWNQTQMSNAVALLSDTHGLFDFDLSASSYNYLQDIQLNPYTVTLTGLGYSQNGKITRNDGIQWQNVDAKAIWRPDGPLGPQEISFGLHGDRYHLNNPVYASTNWSNAAGMGTGQLYTDSIGETRTGGLWAQDAWRITPNLKLTFGGRLETWQALDGFNLNTITTTAGDIKSVATVNQPGLNSTNFSPKASLSFDPRKEWNITANFGEAYRYPTVTELYQNITVNGVATFANPMLTPEQDFNGELTVERKWNDGKARLTLFGERTNNAIISQTNLATNPVNGAQVPTTTIGNVAAIAMQGAELAADKNDVMVNGLRLFGSLTYVYSRIVSDPTWAGTNPQTGQPDSVVGKRVPYVPDWRAKFGFTYRFADTWAWTTAARFSGKQYSTLDNTDIVPHVYGAFDNYFVVDTKIHYDATANFSLDFGIDNILNDQYFLFHPFPGRTYVIAAKYKF